MREERVQPTIGDCIASRRDRRARRRHAAWQLETTRHTRGDALRGRVELVQTAGNWQRLRVAEFVTRGVIDRRLRRFAPLRRPPPAMGPSAHRGAGGDAARSGFVAHGLETGLPLFAACRRRRCRSRSVGHRGDELRGDFCPPAGADSHRPRDHVARHEVEEAARRQRHIDRCCRHRGFRHSPPPNASHDTKLTHENRVGRGPVLPAELPHIAGIQHVRRPGGPAARDHAVDSRARQPRRPASPAGDLSELRQLLGRSATSAAPPRDERGCTLSSYACPTPRPTARQIRRGCRAAARHPVHPAELRAFAEFLPPIGIVLPSSPGTSCHCRSPLARARDSPYRRQPYGLTCCGAFEMDRVPKLNVVGSNPITRSIRHGVSPTAHGAFNAAMRPRPASR